MTREGGRVEGACKGLRVEATCEGQRVKATREGGHVEGALQEGGGGRHCVVCQERQGMGERQHRVASRRRPEVAGVSDILSCPKGVKGGAAASSQDKLR